MTSPSAKKRTVRKLDRQRENVNTDMNNGGVFDIHAMILTRSYRKTV